jgi:hypothetical protein
LLVPSSRAILIIGLCSALGWLWLAGRVFAQQSTAASPAAATGADTRALPDVTELLRQAARNQAAIDQIRKLYTAHLSEENDDTDSNGSVKSRTTKDYDVFYVAGDEVRHLLAKDGKPLEGKEKKHEDERFEKEFDDKKKQQAELAADPKKAAKQDEQEEAQLSDFLRAETFTNPRRTVFRGEDVIAFDFAGNPNYKPKKEIDRIIQKVSGVMWVDDQSSEIVRLEGHFADSAHIAGGVLASLQKGSSFAFEQQKINNEVWLPSYVEIHMAARVLVVKVKANFVDRYTDYQKFQSQSRISAVTPN